jgi:hypothetical protein
MGYRIVAQKILVGKPKGRRANGRFRLTWEDNIKIDLREEGWKEWSG